MIIRRSEQMRQKFWQGSGCDKQTGSRCHLKRNAHTLKQRRRSIATCQNDLVGSARTVIRHHPIDPIPVNHQTVNMPLFRLYCGSGKERLDGIIRRGFPLVHRQQAGIPQTGRLCRNGICGQQFDRIAQFLWQAAKVRNVSESMSGRTHQPMWQGSGTVCIQRCQSCMLAWRRSNSSVIVGIGVDPCPAVGGGSTTAVDRQAGGTRVGTPIVHRRIANQSQ